MYGQARGQMGHVVAMYVRYRPGLCHSSQCLAALFDNAGVIHGHTGSGQGVEVLEKCVLQLHASVPPSSSACPAHFYPLWPHSCMTYGLLCSSKKSGCTSPKVEVDFHRSLVNSRSLSLTGLISKLEPLLTVQLGLTDAPPQQLAAAGSLRRHGGMFGEHD
jgi:hypothetical protein